MSYHPFKIEGITHRTVKKKNKLVIFEIIFSSEYDIKCREMIKYRACNLAPIIITKPFSSLNFGIQTI